ncbi:J domain-containing protein [Planctomycetota bacterium]
MKVEELTNIIELLELPERASFRDIRRQFKKLVLKYHPDRNGGASGDKLVAITAAYEGLLLYCEEYKIPFNKPESQNVDEDWWMKHFGDNM